MNEMTQAVDFYKSVLHQDNMNIEAIACIGTHYFYTDQPEFALKYYRYDILKQFMDITFWLFIELCLDHAK